MAYSTFSHAKITGISAVVPKDGICIEDELEYFGGSLKKAQRMTKMVGMHTRRVAPEGVTSADLCKQAAENLLNGMGVERESVDALIFISQNPDYYMPATACTLQHRLRLSKECAAFDVNQGCTAYTYGLWLAFSLIESRAAKKILLLVGESTARWLDKKNRIITPVFGDCGTATLIERSAEEDVSWHALGTDGSGAEVLMVPAGRSRISLPADGKSYEELLAPILDPLGTPWRILGTYMDGMAVFNFTLDVVPDHIKKLMQYAGLGEANIETLVLHQANRQIAYAVAEKAGFPLEKAPSETFSKYGNQSGASVVATICDMLAERVRNRSSRILISGFGVGLSWASCILDLGPIWCSGIAEYEMPENHPTQEELVDYWRDKLAGKEREPFDY